jgi:hypothetical protein
VAPIASGMSPASRGQIEQAVSFGTLIDCTAAIVAALFEVWCKIILNSVPGPLKTRRVLA